MYREILDVLAWRKRRKARSVSGFSRHFNTQVSLLFTAQIKPATIWFLPLDAFQELYVMTWEHLLSITLADCDKNDWNDQIGFQNAGYFRPMLHCVIRRVVPRKIRVVRSGVTCNINAGPGVPTQYDRCTLWWQWAARARFRCRAVCRWLPGLTLNSAWPSLRG